MKGGGGGGGLPTRGGGGGAALGALEGVAEADGALAEATLGAGVADGEALGAVVTTSGVVIDRRSAVGSASAEASCWVACAGAFFEAFFGGRVRANASAPAPASPTSASAMYGPRRDGLAAVGFSAAPVQVEACAVLWPSVEAAALTPGGAEGRSSGEAGGIEGDVARGAAGAVAAKGRSAATSSLTDS